MLKRTFIFSIVFLLHFYSSFSYSELPNSSPKVIFAKQIFNKISQSFNNQLLAPNLILIKNDDHIIAEFRPSPSPIVLLNEKVYDLCVQQKGKSADALAVILGHELAHYYLQHDWYDTYGLGSTKNKSHADLQYLEKSADYYGCFYAQLAGFKPSILPQMLDLVYLKFKLNDKILGYPNKEFRKTTFANKQKELSDLAMVFDAAKALYSIKAFELSASCFEEIAKHFSSPEILNNLGACYLQFGLKEIGISSQEFIYPIEFDINTRLNSTRGELIDDNIKKSIKYFEKAFEIDKEYLPAKINLACAYDLLKNYEASIGLLKQIDNLSADGHSILAISLLHDNKVEMAEKHFELAKKGSGFGSSYNLDVFLNKYTTLGKIKYSMSYVQNTFKKWLLSEKKNLNTSNSGNIVILKLINEYKLKKIITNTNYEINGSKFLKIAINEDVGLHLFTSSAEYKILNIPLIKVKNVLKSKNGITNILGKSNYIINQNSGKSLVFEAISPKNWLILELSSRNVITKCKILTKN